MEDRIINKVKKILAIAHDEGAAEGERDNALRMAYNLMAKHNLSMTSLQDKPEDRGMREEMFYGRPWATSLCNSVASMFFCHYIVRKSPLKNMAGHIFVGKESNAATALEMSRWLIDSIKKEASRRAYALNENMTWRRSFCEGAVSKIRVRIRDMKEEVSKEAGTGTSLILVSLYDSEKEANQEWTRSNLQTKVEKPRKQASVLSGAYQAGSSYGSSVALNKQIRS